jgi:ketosteroid isomerase-like protein
MSVNFSTPQDAEDTYYDAIDENDLDAMMSVWEDSDEILCLLPMMPAQRGTASIRKAWEPLLGGEMQLDMEIKHLAWIEAGDLAIHLVEEQVQVAGQQGKQSVYASNTYRKGANGWRILMHQNSPTPPPDLQMPGMG